LEPILFAMAAVAMGAAVYLGLRDPPLRYPQTTAILMQVLDPDHDGSISQAEYEALTSGGGSFALLDQDRDQRLSQREVELLLLTVNPDFHRDDLDDR
jgi:hypothetical protein